jgi:hypothetical protein
MKPVSLYAAFLYGVNIPGGRRFTGAQVSSGLRRLQPALMFASIVGRPDSVVLWASEPATEQSVRYTVSGALDCACVVLSAATLEGIVQVALDAARAAGLSETAPYRVTRDGVEWELCVVLSSDTLPPDSSGDRWLFRPTTNAVAVAVLGRRALLARKRRLTPTGSRVMLGAALNDPWERALEGNGVTVGCLTSRTLNRLVEVLAATTALREA